MIIIIRPVCNNLVPFSCRKIWLRKWERESGESLSQCVLCIKCWEKRKNFIFIQVYVSLAWLGLAWFGLVEFRFSNSRLIFFILFILSLSQVLADPVQFPWWRRRRRKMLGVSQFYAKVLHCNTLVLLSLSSSSSYRCSTCVWYIVDIFILLIHIVSRYKKEIKGWWWWWWWRRRGWFVLYTEHDALSLFLQFIFHTLFHTLGLA